MYSRYMKSCGNCSKSLVRNSAKYCSNSCQLSFQYEEYIEKWKDGITDGNRGVSAKNLSRHLIRYLFNKYNNCCSICRWSQVNIYTGKIPLEVDHVDGNSNNNLESNLRLICPNCHSLSSKYKNLNRGMGREWRRLKYLKINR